MNTAREESHLCAHSPAALSLNDVDPVVKEIARLLRLQRDEWVAGDGDFQAGKGPQGEEHMPGTSVSGRQREGGDAPERLDAAQNVLDWRPALARPDRDVVASLCDVGRLGKDGCERVGETDRVPPVEPSFRRRR